MNTLATIVDTKALAKVIGAAFAAGIGVTTVFAFVIVGGTRFADLRREGRGAAAVAFGALAVACLLAVAGAVALAIVIMTNK